MNLRKDSFRPSNTERFLNCNLSVLLPEKGKTEEQLAYLRERSEDHERLFRGEFLASEEKCKEFHDKVVDACRSNVFREQKLQIDIKGFLFEGTPDVFAYDRETKTLFVIDYKTGFQNVVAWENKQLLSYACMVLLSEELDWEIEDFVLAILNTKSDIVSMHHATKDTILKHVARIERSLSFTYEESTFYATKGKWCQFCPSKTYCPLQRSVGDVKQYMDHDTDALIYEKEKRHKEMNERIKELKTKEGLSEVFDYRLIEKKRFKYRKDAPDDLVATKKLTAAEAKKTLDAVNFDKYFEEETINAFAIGDKKS